MPKEFYEKLESLNGQIPEKLLTLMCQCYKNYRTAVYTSDESWISREKVFCTYLDLVEKQVNEPYDFEPFHKKIRKPYDYEAFSMDFMKPLIVLEQSTVLGEKNLKKIEELILSGSNAILFSNHQTEPDPQIISVLLQKNHPKLAKNMIFIAGDRVVTDPMAVPFSMGCNLICIYSKKHIETPPELKEEKLKHNQRTMKIFRELLSEGGKCVWVAPSGGRDRPEKNGALEAAPFDPQSIEMLYLMAKKADKPTHFFPLTLSTYNILPPPNSVDQELGEERKIQRFPAHLAFGEEINMDFFPGSEEIDKKIRRQKRAEFIWSLVKNNQI